MVLFLSMIFAAGPCRAEIKGMEVEAENVQKKAGRVEAYGNVVITGNNMDIRANYVVYDTVKDDVWAIGNCRLKEKGSEMEAEALYYNLTRKDFQLENGSIFIYKEPVIISGKSITRYGEDQYEGSDIEFTPCIGDEPAWSLAAADFEAPLEKYGTAKHVRFQIRDLPVLYVPYLFFPIKLQRQSGVLLPSISHSSDYGYRFGLPLYLVLSRSTDMTITPTLLSRRGLLMLGEYRYRLNEKEYGEVYVESLMKDKWRGDEYGEGTTLDKVPEGRWLFRSFQKGGDLTWDVKLVSAPDYFKDIGTMYGDDMVWKDIITTDSLSLLAELVSRGQYNASGSTFSANFSGRWSQNLTALNDDKTFQELPRATFRLNQRGIPQTPAFVSAEMSSAYVYSIDWTRAFKNNAQAQLSLPLSYFPYFTLMPTVTHYYRDSYISHNSGMFQSDSIRQSWENRDPAITSSYSPAFFGNNPGVLEEDPYREIWQRRDLSITTTLYSSRFMDGLYHQVAPSVAWTYFSRMEGNYDPHDPEDFFPELLAQDEWNREFTLKPSIDNYIRNRAGESLVEFSLSRVYNYLTKEWDYYEGNLVFKPVSWLTGRHLNRFGKKPHPWATLEHWSQFNVQDPRGDELYASEEYNNAAQTKTAVIGMKLFVMKGLDVRFETKYDFHRDHFVLSRQGVQYTSQCWGVDFYRLTEDEIDNLPRETTVGVTVNLLGLGQVIHTKRSREGSIGQ